MDSLAKPSAAATEPEQPGSQYAAIVELCRKSQEILAKGIREGVPFLEALHANIASFRPAGQPPPEVARLFHALLDFQSHEPMWKEYSARTQGPVEFRHADFSKLCFIFARLKEHNFLGCDFRGSIWSFSAVKDGDCTGSDFSGIVAIGIPFDHANCSGCNLTNAQIITFDPFHSNNFENAVFTNAKLFSSHSFFYADKLASKSRFHHAVMNGCRLSIEREEQPQHNRTRQELESVLKEIFSPDQLAVMHIDYGLPGFFDRLSGLRH